MSRSSGNSEAAAQRGQLTLDERLPLETPQRFLSGPLVFKNPRLFFLGSDDIPKEAKASAAADLNRALGAGCTGFEIAQRIPLAEIARAHELAEHPGDGAGLWLW